MAGWAVAGACDVDLQVEARSTTATEVYLSSTPRPIHRRSLSAPPGWPGNEVGPSRCIEQRREGEP
eukprot:3178042-Alexandrium_andersonii.AAC.1